MLFLYRFFLGILEIEIYGIYPEKVLNICEKNKISLWDIRIKRGKLCCKINVRDYRKMPRLFKRQGVRLHILNRRGLPFFTNKYKRRFGVALGVVLFFSLLIYLSSFVWVIKVHGNKKVSEAEILSLCRQIGINEGIKADEFDMKIKAQELLLKSDKLSWASFNLEGCVLTVDVTEITEKEEIKFTASNLIADSDGTVKHIDVTVGDCVVKVGDTVKKGDLLVSGLIESESGVKFVNSRGKIIAETAEVIYLEQKYDIKETYLLGRQKTKRVLEFFTLKLPLFLGGESDEFESEYSVKNLELFGKPLPIKLHKRNFIFTETRDYKIGYENACERLLKTAEEQYPNGKIKYEFYDKGDRAVMNGVICESRNIAKSQGITIENSKTPE